jgi:hypothetical protein
MNIRTYTNLGIVLFLVLSVLDLVHTYLLIQNGGGQVYEGNPIARSWLLRYGWTGLALFKGASIFVVLACVLLLNRYRPQSAALVITIACVVLLVVAFYSHRLLAREEGGTGYFRKSQQTSFLPSRP